jgi:hypothetical protein
MARIDMSEINRNRRVCADNTIESPFNAAMEDTDADYPQRLYDQLPEDNIGLMPTNERLRSKK